MNVFSEGMVMQLCMYVLFGDGYDRLKMLKQKEQNFVTNHRVVIIK